MRKMTKRSFIKEEKYIYAVGLTNLDLGFRVKGEVLRIWFQIKKKLKLKFSK